MSVCSVLSDSLQPLVLQPARFLCPLDFPGKNRGVDCHYLFHINAQFTSVAQLCLTICDPTNASQQALLSITNCRRLLKLMSTKSVMPCNYFILCLPLLLLPSVSPSSRVFSNESVFFASGGQSIRDSASASVFQMNIHN